MKLGRDNYNRLYELLGLIDTLRRSVCGLTYDDIRERFGWGRRTAERMLTVIETAYCHSFVRERGADKKVYFRLGGGDKFPPNCISENEIIALRTALGFVRNNEPLKLPLESLAGKLENMRDSAGSNIEDMMLVSGTASAPRPHIRINRRVLDPLQDAALAFRVVNIKYRAAESRRISSQTVCPLGFLYGVQNNYLIASQVNYVNTPCHYILSHIESVKPLEKYFDAKGFDIRKYAARSFGVWVSRAGGYNVTWRVKPEAAERAARFVFHPTQKMTPQRDGSLIVEFTADGLNEMAWHLMTWEGMIQPLAPKELIKEYKSQLKLAARALAR